MKYILALILGIVIGRMMDPGDPNAAPTYGETGLPKNCRAIIQMNIDEWEARKYTAEEIISSIGRNCGQFGYSWGQ